MKLTVLADNNTLIDRYFLGEPAVSYFIESRGRRVLFDAGYSDVFLRNADRLGIDLTLLDAVVLSHGHADHTCGLPLLAEMIRRSILEDGDSGRRKPLLVAHPAAFFPKVLETGEDIGAGFLPGELADVFEYLPSTGPIDLGGGLTFMGQIPRIHAGDGEGVGFRIVPRDYPSRIMPDFLPPVRIREEWEAAELRVETDNLEDDSALLCSLGDGVVIVTGCSHSGIRNIVDRAVELSRDAPVIDIVGGFHLLDAAKSKIEATVSFLDARAIRSVHACHCTDLAAKIGLSSRLRVKELGSGSVIEYA